MPSLRPHVPYRQWTLYFPHRVRWVQLKQDALCPAEAYEHDSGCYLPVGKVDRPDTSIWREP
jgi:hypothetical protein